MTLKILLKNTVLLLVFTLNSCGSNSKSEQSNQNEILRQVQVDNNVIVGANQTQKYLPFIKGKRVGIVANQTSVIFHSDSKTYTHLVDSLLSQNIDVVRVFAPEHGFRGSSDAGEIVKDGMDNKTGLPIISLYGKNKKPSFSDHDLDLVIFDIQDVGARFYTYISTLHYVMEACAEQNIPLLVLDRPNPNGHYTDGPILELEHRSFVGMHPVPVVHGLTIGEYTQMINGEKWLDNGIQCELTIIPMENYTHQMAYSLPIKPSPNLPNDVSINLYPSLCFFEGTNVSVGRGTDKQFQVIGSPFLHYFSFAFVPKTNEGAKYPKHEGKTCLGMNLSQSDKLNELNLDWLIDFYKANQKLAPNEVFFNDFFTKLAGTEQLQKQIEQGLNEEQIKATWQEGIHAFTKMREPYLLYE